MRVFPSFVYCLLRNVVFVSLALATSLSAVALSACFAGKLLESSVEGLVTPSRRLDILVR